MLRSHWQSSLDRSRFHGTLVAGQERWEVYFVEVRRTDLEWLVDCVAVGPRAIQVTLRCRSDVSHTHVAHRLMAALRRWLAAGNCRDAACIDVTDPLEQAS